VGETFLFYYLNTLVKPHSVFEFWGIYDANCLPRPICVTMLTCKVDCELFVAVNILQQYMVFVIKTLFYLCGRCRGNPVQVRCTQWNVVYLTARLPVLVSVTATVSCCVFEVLSGRIKLRSTIHISACHLTVCLRPYNMKTWFYFHFNDVRAGLETLESSRDQLT